MKYIIIISFTLFISLNIFLLNLNQKNQKNIYLLNNKKNNIILQNKFLSNNLDKIYLHINNKIISKELDIKLTSLKIQKKISLIYMNYEACSSCNDKFLFDIEKLKENKSNLIKDAILVLGIGGRDPKDGEILNLKKVFKNVIIVSNRHFYIKNRKEKLKTFFALINKNSRILQYIEYDINNPRYFANGIKNITKTLVNTPFD